MGKSPISEPVFDPDLFDLRHVVDLALAAKREAMPAPKPTGWRSSSLGYCLRRQYLERAGVPSLRDKEREPGDKVNRVFFIGDLIHDGVQRLVKQAGLMLMDEMRLHSDKLQLTGHVDLIWGGEVQDVEQHELVNRAENYGIYLGAMRDTLRDAYGTFPVTMTELKTAAEYSAEKMFTEGPAFHHLMQAGSYGLLAEETGLNESLPSDVERVQITVLGKSSLLMPQFDVLPLHIERARERVEELNEWWAIKEQPPCSCGQQISWERKYCTYRADPQGNQCCASGLIETASETYWEEVEAAYEEDQDGEVEATDVGVVARSAE